MKSVHSLILSHGTAFTSTPQLRHERDRHVKIFRFDSWILLKHWRYRVMAGSLHVHDGRSAYRLLAWSRPAV